jgi:hypothetical protein
MQEPGENSSKISRQQTRTNINPDINSAAEDPTYTSQNPEVRETYLSSVYSDSISGGRMRPYGLMASFQAKRHTSLNHAIESTPY